MSGELSMCQCDKMRWQCVNISKWGVNMSRRVVNVSRWGVNVSICQGKLSIIQDDVWEGSFTRLVSTKNNKNNMNETKYI